MSPRGVRSELGCRRLEDLHRPLENPHPESNTLGEQGFDGWAAGLPDEHGELLYEASAVKPVRWVEGQGWTEGRE